MHSILLICLIGIKVEGNCEPFTSDNKVPIPHGCLVFPLQLGQGEVKN